jgi:1H-pyrrole-2-carbonyl-[peptidyl-carrier protein] chlorinase
MVIRHWGVPRRLPREGATIVSDAEVYDADVIVIGGGPAGSTLASYLAMNGYDPVILERDIHPREHVGESLVPSANKMLEEIGFFEKMDYYGFIRKPGASWTSFKGKTAGPELLIRFKDSPQPGINQDYTYHVDRSRFDSLLLKHSSELGARVVQGANVLRVTFDQDDRATGVRVRVLGKEFDLRSRFVVDASGRRGLLGKQRGLMEKDPLFNQFAIYSWFENVTPPTEDTADFIHIHFLPVERGWVWQIPIYHGVTSVGVVVEKAEFNKAGQDYETFFNSLIEMGQNTRFIMDGAKRVRPWFVEGDYSYMMKEFAGKGWMLIGDAARFVDPIFSSGVSVAMNSAKFAFGAIEETMKGGDEQELFQQYATTIKNGVSIWYEWITLYYKLQHLFTLFSRNKQYKFEMQKLLQGEVYDRDAVQILDRMRQAVKTIEATEGHLLKPMISETISID